MSSNPSKSLTPFAQSSLNLDTDFRDLERLSGQITHIDIETDDGLNRAQQLLAHFTECGQRISVGIQDLAKSLSEMRDRAEKAAQVVSERAEQIQARRQENNQIANRFKLLSETVNKITATLSQFKKPPGEQFTSEEKVFLASQLSEVSMKLSPLIEEAQKLREDARNSNLKSLERNADSLGQTLEAARRKLATVIPTPPTDSMSIGE